MWTLNYTTQFKKDLKHYKGNKEALKALSDVLSQLHSEGKVKPSLRPHRLSGTYVDCMECHILSDFLLIWINEKEKIISLVRLGSHSQLFK